MGRSIVGPLWAIAMNAFREAVRDRVLYAFVLFAFVSTAGGLLLGTLSVGQDLRVLEDLGLAVIAFIGGIIGIFIGTSLVYKEIERKTVFLIVTKPISRWQFVLGKYLGLSLCLFVVTLLMGLFLALVVALSTENHVVSPLLAAALLTIYLELLFVTAVATFFSTFATPIMSVVFTLSVWLIGHSGQSLRQLGRLSESESLRHLFDSLYWFMPDLASLTQMRGALMYGRLPDSETVILLCAYVLAYALVLLSLATLVTENREFS